MLASVWRYSTGLGDAEVYTLVEKDDGGANVSFWNFVTLAWVSPEVADCRKFLKDRGNGNYQLPITLPAGGPYNFVYKRLSTGEEIGRESTAIDDAVSSRANQTSVNAIPTNPTLQTVWTDAKAANLDASVSSRSTLTAGDVWAYTTRTLTSFGTLVTDVRDSVWSATTRTLTGLGTLVADIWSYATRALTTRVVGTDTLPTKAEIEASTVIAKEATLNSHETARATMQTVLQGEHATIAGYVDTEITAVINALSALQTDVGDPSINATTIYAQILAIKDYVDTLETALATHEANRASMQIALVAEHDATQAAVALIPKNPVNVISAIDGALKVDSVEDGGIITVYRKTSIAITFNLGKNLTGRKLYFAVRKDIADAAYSIPNGGTIPKEITSTTDLLTGAGYIGLTPTELNIAAGLYTYVEIQSVSNAGGDPIPERLFQLRVKDHALNL